MNKLLDYMGELQVNKDVSGEAIPRQSVDQTHGVHGIFGDLGEAIPDPPSRRVFNLCLRVWRAGRRRSCTN